MWGRGQAEDATPGSWCRRRCRWAGSGPDGCPAAESGEGVRERTRVTSAQRTQRIPGRSAPGAACPIGTRRDAARPVSTGVRRGAHRTRGVQVELPHGDSHPVRPCTPSARRQPRARGVAWRETAQRVVGHGAKWLPRSRVRMAPRAWGHRGRRGRGCARRPSSPPPARAARARTHTHGLSAAAPPPRGSVARAAAACGCWSRARGRRGVRGAPGRCQRASCPKLRGPSPRPRWKCTAPAAAGSFLRVMCRAGRGKGAGGAGGGVGAADSTARLQELTAVVWGPMPGICGRTSGRPRRPLACR